MNLSKGAFEGVKVMEFVVAVAGPLNIKYLADQGATVVRVESQTRPDPLRLALPYKDGKPGVNRGGVWNTFHINRYSLGLNLKNPRSREVIERLVKWADIVMENFSPGSLEKLGLGYDDLRKIKPDIIMMRASIQGQTGPHSSQPGYGQQAAALTGHMALLGWPDRAPAIPFDGFTDFILPRYGAATLIAALDYKRRTGKGQCLDISQFETAIQILAPHFLDYTVNNRETTRMGNSSPYACPHGAYPCRGEDRWCAIAVSSDYEWEAFCVVLGDPDWSRDPRFATLLGRKENEDELDRLIGEWSVNFPAEQVMGMMQTAGVPAGVVQSAVDLLQDPQLSYREQFWRMNHAELGEHRHFGQPFILSKSPTTRRTSPCLGEHTEYVCTKLLGMTEEEFIDLFTNGILD